jgi:endonuclease VIII
VPEGDAVLRTARRLHTALAGEPLNVVDLRWGRLEGSALHGGTTVEVVSVGKHLLHRVDTGHTLHTHLRMEGRWQTMPREQVSPRQRRSPRLRALLATPRMAALGWQLGLVEVLPTDQEHRVVGHLGPDLLGPDWDEALALAKLRRQPERELAEALLDQRNLAGLGTIFTSEPLFLQRLSPWTAVGDLGTDDLTAVVRRARTLLQASISTGQPIPTGDPREPMYVFGRRGLPCRRCGGTVRMAVVGTAPQDRVLCYCPSCQGGMAPHDDGRAQRPLGAARESGRGNDLGVGGRGDR